MTNSILFTVIYFSFIPLKSKLEFYVALPWSKGKIEPKKDRKY